MNKTIDVYDNIVVVSQDEANNVIPFNKECILYVPPTNQHIEIYSTVADISNPLTQAALLDYYI